MRRGLGVWFGAALAGVMLCAVGFGCATTGLSAREENLGMLLKRPRSGCRVVGPVQGLGGGTGGAWLDNASLKTMASNDLLHKAVGLGATHVWMGAPNFGRNSAGQVESVAIDGEAYVCTGPMVFDADPAPVASAPEAAATNAAHAPVAGLRALDPKLWRAWQGTASQPGFGKFEAELDLSRSGAFGSCGSIEYPELGCRGMLEQCRDLGNGTLEATQSLSTVGRCVDQSKLRLRLQGAALAGTWFLPDGRVAAQGTLSPPSNDSALLSASRRALPALPARAEPVLDDEVYEVLPQFLPEVLPEGFVTDDPATTRVSADRQFRVLRSYRRADGIIVNLTLLFVRSKAEGATATLEALAKGGKPVLELAGFPSLSRSSAAGGRGVVYVVLSPRLQIEVDAVGVPTKTLEKLLRGLSLGYLAQVESGGRSAIEALSRTQVFEDPQGQKVEMATGQSAFADRVVSAQAGTRQGPQKDANQTLGPPDYNGQTGHYTLGCRGKLVLAFENNVLSDGKGPDLHIFEVGRLVEAMGVRISEDGASWLDAGQVRGQPASLDIASVARPGAGYRFVEVSDLGHECANDSAGADIDAVGAINGELLADAAPRRKPVVKKSGPDKAGSSGPGVAGGREDLQKVAEAVRQSEGVPLSVSLNGQGFSLSEASSGYKVETSGTVRADVNGDGRVDTVFINTRRTAQRTEHELAIYTERQAGIGPLAQAVIGYGDPGPKAGTLRVSGTRITFAMAEQPFAYELRHGSLIRLQP